MKLDVKVNKLLGEGLKNKLITVQQHPTLPLRIYNYTRKAEYDMIWNEATALCRGLILDENKNIVSRPFKKFFSTEQLTRVTGTALVTPPAGDYALYEKMDGSLGIFYSYEDAYGISTRGSFISDQAQKACEILNTKYAAYIPKLLALHRDGRTPLFEIIYPENKIIVDYGQAERLVLLDVIDNETGMPDASFAMDDIWPEVDKVKFVEIINTPRIGSVLMHLDTKRRERGFQNKEGYVAVHTKTGYRIKIKFHSYLELHKLMFGMTTRYIWELLRRGTLETVIKPLPTTEKSIIISYAKILQEDFDKEKAKLYWDFETISQKIGAFGTRKEFAKLATKHDHPDLMFLMFDKIFHDDSLWRKLRPVFSTRVTGKEPVE